MTVSLLLIEGEDVTEEDLHVSLANAKQLVLGNSLGLGWVVEVRANSSADLGSAVQSLAQVPGATGAFTLAVRRDSFDEG